jgi:hypothetical protein
MHEVTTMNSAIKKPPSAASNQSKAISEISELFERYGPTFVDLAVGKRSDMDALLEFYDAPLRFIGSSFHMVMKDKEDITGQDGIGGEIGRLRHAHFAGSTLDKCDVKILNARAAFVDAIWLRQDSAGTIERFNVTYLLGLTQHGWRITSAVDTSE